MITRVPLTDDERLDLIPELSDLSGAISIQDDSYISVAAMLADNPGEQLFLFDPGNYEDWDWTIRTVQGTAESRIVFAYVDTETHPLRRQEHAYLPTVLIDYTSEYLVFHGFTCRTEVNQQITLGWGANNITWSDCHHTRFGSYGIRIRIGAHTNKVQRCTFFDPLLDGGDSIGVQIQTFDWSGDENLHDNKILDCEFRNCVDAVQLTDQATDKTASLDGTVIAGCDVYTTSDYYSTNGDGVRAGTENAFDLKHASLDDENPVIIENNRVWGLRYTDPSLAGSGSNGAVFTNQRYSENVIFRNNIADDCVLGVYEQPWLGGTGMSGTRNTQLSGNIWANIRPRHTNDLIGGGVYLASNMPLQIDGDQIVNCWRIAADANNETNGAHSISNCRREGSALGEMVDEWNANPTNRSGQIRVAYERRRFSGPEWAYINTDREVNRGRIYNHVALAIKLKG